MIDYRKLNEQLEASRDEAVTKDEAEGSLPGDADASILGAYLGIYPMQVDDWQPCSAASGVGHAHTLAQVSE